MKVAFFEIRDCAEEPYIRQHLTDFELVFSQDVISEKNMPSSDTDILSVFVGSKVDKQVLDQCPHLRLIATRSTGFDHIDLKLCRERHIAVVNVPRYGENTVAEFTFALLLALARKLYPSIKRVREEHRFCCDGLQGFDLKGKTIGVVGTGNIGTPVVKISAGFGMHILAFDPYPQEKLVTDFGVRYVTLAELLRESDVITLHVPYMPSTHHLINKENLKTVKKGAVLINTARGAVVETEGLVWALQQGLLAGAGLDVLEEEGCVVSEIETLLERHPNEEALRTLLIDHALMHMPNVLVTPHNAFNAVEALGRILGTTIDNIKYFLDDKPMNVVR
ncbi:TPA: hydroxyacid dehydrogenase [Candidatus Dependentiae bacterium]|nr:MAG: D-isomer specific 2-hydroxyacid dehydrogenase NAD-binding protein [candidate division TM6 bacterium GW2011_GWF2_43_87]HBL98816.1 hydroxyacid dehydrogenase [Candidatus Dependentiae bacterium]